MTSINHANYRHKTLLTRFAGIAGQPNVFRRVAWSVFGVVALPYHSCRMFCGVLTVKLGNEAFMRYERGCPSFLPCSDSSIALLYYIICSIGVVASALSWLFPQGASLWKVITSAYVGSLILLLVYLLSARRTYVQQVRINESSVPKTANVFPIMSIIVSLVYMTSALFSHVERDTVWSTLVAIDVMCGISLNALGGLTMVLMVATWVACAYISGVVQDDPTFRMNESVNPGSTVVANPLEAAAAPVPVPQPPAQLPQRIGSSALAASAVKDDKTVMASSVLSFPTFPFSHSTTGPQSSLPKGMEFTASSVFMRQESGTILHKFLSLLAIYDLLFVPTTSILLHACVHLPVDTLEQKIFKVGNFVILWYHIFFSTLFHCVIYNDVHTCVNSRFCRPSCGLFNSALKLGALLLLLLREVVRDRVNVVLSLYIASCTVMFCFAKQYKTDLPVWQRGPWSSVTTNAVFLVAVLCLMWAAVVAVGHEYGLFSESWGAAVVVLVGWVFLVFSRSGVPLAPPPPAEHQEDVDFASLISQWPHPPPVHTISNAPTSSLTISQTPTLHPSIPPATPSALRPLQEGASSAGTGVDDASLMTNKRVRVMNAKCDSTKNEDGEVNCSIPISDGSRSSRGLGWSMQSSLPSHQKERPGCFSVSMRSHPGKVELSSVKSNSSSEEGEPPDRGYFRVNEGETRDGFVFSQKLGWGQFGTVWLVKDKQHSGDMVALKIAKCLPAYTEAAAVEIAVLQKINEEAKALSASNTSLERLAWASHIVHLRGHTVLTGDNNEKHTAMAFDVCGPNLLMLLKNHRCESIELPIIKTIVRDILKALAFLHDTVRVVHTDIKPENIMLKILDPRVLSKASRGTCTAGECAQNDNALHGICDSEMVRSLDHWYSIVVGDLGTARWIDGSYDVSTTQTREYRSPEVILGVETVTPAVDLWSCACLTYELVVGSYLFNPKCKPEEERHSYQLSLFQQLLGPLPIASMTSVTLGASFFRKGEFKGEVLPRVQMLDLLKELHFPQHEKESLADFLLTLLRFVPGQRLTAFEALSHPFLDGQQSENF